MNTKKCFPSVPSVLLAGLLVASAAVTGMAGPASASLPPSTFRGQASDIETQTKEWFNLPFGFDAGRLGGLHGRLRFVTDTTSTLSATRDYSVVEQGSLQSGQTLNVAVRNEAVASRLQVTARPALQLIFEWQPQGESFGCSMNDPFPDLNPGEWFRRTDNFGEYASQGVCGAIEITADDLTSIREAIDGEPVLPEVFTVLDKFFTAGYTGSQTLAASHEFFEIPVCQMITDFFGIPYGDRCGIQMNANIAAPLAHVGHEMQARVCTDQLNPLGAPLPCMTAVGPLQSLAFTDSVTVFSVPGICTTDVKPYELDVHDAIWKARLDDVTLGISLDFNVRLQEDGDGWDVATVNVPASISLLNTPQPLTLDFNGDNRVRLGIGEVHPDTYAPLVALNPSAVTVAEGQTTTLAPAMADHCTATGDLSVQWTIDGARISGTPLTRTYTDDKPNAVHNGSLTVRDQAGNFSTPIPFSITVRNVPPSVQLAGMPTEPIPVGTTVSLSTQVADPGADVLTWAWSWGDGTTENVTGDNAQDRTDSRRHTYTTPGVRTVQVGVHDGTDLQSAGGAITVFDPADRLVGSGTFIADRSSIGVPVGSHYSAQGNVQYAQGSVRPSGTFTADYELSIGGNETISKHLVATSFEWLIENGMQSEVQGLATINGEKNWKFHAEVTRSKTGAQTARITVTVWRPGITSFANPDYRFGGPRETGNIQ